MFEEILSNFQNNASQEDNQPNRKAGCKEKVRMRGSIYRLFRKILINYLTNVWFCTIRLSHPSYIIDAIMLFLWLLKREIVRSCYYF